MRIHQLPPLVANQIAAGEVIERPASVVKELLENALDAGADVLSIELHYGGLNHIKVSDNGCGIVVDDLPLSIAAHATSKIHTLNDLYSIETMGFRGEALASIASIAKVTICSRPRQQEHAYSLTVHGDSLSIKPSPRTYGTTVDVIDLFYNAPVRKRFLKSERLEYQAIESVVKRFAMSAPHMAITVKHNGKLVVDLPAAKNEAAILTRLTKLFGSSFIKDSIYLDVERSGMRLYGWISGHQFQRSQNDRQWVYINQRMVRDKLIFHALKQSYDGILHPGRFPACLLYLCINRSELDVNVHPTKHEVRFQQPRLIHDFFTSQLAEALKSISSNSIEDSDKYSLRQENVKSFNLCEPNALISFKHHRLQPAIPVSINVEEADWMILNPHYALIFIMPYPYLVDVKALYGHWLGKLIAEQSFPLPKRPLLVPIECLVPDQLINQSEELADQLRQLGIEVDFRKKNYILIKSIPLITPYLDFQKFVSGLAQINILDQDLLIQTLCQAQTLDISRMSHEEKMNINSLLIDDHHDELKNKLYYKELTIDGCRLFLNV